MKILAIGDFHGKLPEKILKVAKSKDIDIILSSGDFPNTEKIRDLQFKYWTGKKWFEVIGLKRAKKLEKDSFDSGLKVLKKLNSINKKIYIVWGNSDFYRDTNEPKEIMPGFYNDRIKTLKNIKLIDRRKIKIKGLEFIGHGRYVDVTEYIKHPVDKDKKKQNKRLKRYNKTKKELFRLFSKNKPKEGFIFLTHYTPYGIFDMVKFKTSPMYGKHVGFEPYNQIIRKYNPLIMICGHMHEYQGKQKLGKTIIINPGDSSNGKAAIIEIIGKKIKNIKFIH